MSSPTSMTLNLKLAGVANMVNAINRLNDALKKLNKGFNTAASGINRAANRIANAAGTLKNPNKNKPVGGGGGSGGSGSGTNAPDFSQQNTESMIFSLMQGQFGIAFAKAMTRLMGKAVIINAANRMRAPNTPPHTQAGSAIAELGSKFAILVAVIAAVITAIAIAVKVFTELADRVKNLSKAFWASGGNAKNSAALYNIARASGIDPEQLASQAGGETGMGTQFLAKLEALRQLAQDNPEAAAKFAKMHGLTNVLPTAAHATNKEWKDMMEGKGTSFDPKRGGRRIFEYTKALGEMQRAWDELAITLTPIIQLVAQMIQGFATFTDWIIKLATAMNPILYLIKLIRGEGSKDFGQQKNADKFKASVDKFGGTVEKLDKMTDKQGTFGGGNRAQNPIPNSWRWYGDQAELIRQADRLGQFEF